MGFPRITIKDFKSSTSLKSLNDNFMNLWTKVFGNINGTDIKDQAITSQQIKDMTIDRAKIADAAIGSAQIDNLAVQTAHIDNAAITSAKIGEAAVDTANITNLAVTSEKIANSTITNAQIANATIKTANIELGAVTTALIGTAAVDTVQIKDGSITDAKVVNLSANSITAGTLSVDRLIIRGATTSLVYALNNISGALQSQNVNTLNGEVLTSRTITADKIVANAITANEIATATITANKMVAGTITAASGIIASIDAGKITTGTLDASKVTVKNLNASNITTGTISGSKISGGTITGALLKTSNTAAYVSLENNWIKFYQESSCKLEIGTRFNNIQGFNRYTASIVYNGTATGTYLGGLFFDNVSGAVSYNFVDSGAWSSFTAPGIYSEIEDGDVYAVYTDAIGGSLNSESIMLGTQRISKIDVALGAIRLYNKYGSYVDNGIVIAQNGVVQIKCSNVLKHLFKADGTKTGGSIEIDGVNWGMSPIDSPRILISDVLYNVVVNESGTEIPLDSLFAKTINGYAVFPSNGKIEIVSKGKTSFIVKGYTGVCDFYVIGNRIKHEDYYFESMLKMEGDLNNGI